MQINLDPVESLKSIMAVTDYLLQRFSVFKTAEDYFSEYGLQNDALRELAVETTIITAADDPIIPVEDFYKLELNDLTRLSIHAFGGHNGFIDGIFLKSWYEDVLADIFDEIVKASRLGG